MANGLRPTSCCAPWAPDSTTWLQDAPGFPARRHWAETGDVLQGAVLRLLNALREVQPATTRDFINLAAVQIRRELLDLARRFARRRQETESEDDLSEVVAPALDLDTWYRFHEAVEQLPVLEREVVSLLFYQGSTSSSSPSSWGMAFKAVPAPSSGNRRSVP